MKKTLISVIMALMLVAIMAAPALADSPTTGDVTANVTVTGYASVTITDKGDAGLDFGSMTPGQDMKAEAASPSISIAAGSENNQDVVIEISGTDFSGTAGSFAIANAYWNDEDTSGTATAMKLTGTATDTVATLGAGESVDIYHWLSVPDGQATGSYSSTFTYSSDATVVNP
jgi:hypothetical protein